MVVGAIAGLAVLVFSGWSLYRFLLVFLIFVIIPVLYMITRSITRTLLAALAFAIPLGFGFAPFGSIPYHDGGAQPGIAIYLYDFPLMGLVALWAWQVLAMKKPVPKNGILWAAILWITWSILSIYNSTNQRLSWFEVLRMVKLCILMLVVSTLVRDKLDFQTVLYALLFGLITQSIICAVQYTTGSDLGLGLFVTGELNRVSGTIGWPNTVGAYAAAMSAIAFVLFLNNASEKLKWLSLVAGFAGFFTLIITFSRGGWIAFFIALAAGIFISYRMKWINKKDVFRLVMICLAGAIVAIPFLSGISVRLAQTNVENGAIAGRFSLNQVAFNMIMTHPVLGVGINTYVEVDRGYDTTGITYNLPYPVHNVYLLVAAETGLIGLGLFLVFIVTIFYGFLQPIKYSDHFISSSAICLLCALLALLISNLADNHLRTEVLYSLFWFLAGLGVALSGMVQSPPVNQRIGGSVDTTP